MHEKFLSELLLFGIKFSQLSGELLGQARPKELTPTQFELMQVLAQGPGTTLSSLCNCAKLSLPNGSRELRKLREMGLVQKSEVATDKRLTAFALSPAGEQCIHQAYQRLSLHAWELYGSKAPKELDLLADCLATLRDKL